MYGNKKLVMETAPPGRPLRDGRKAFDSWGGFMFVSNITKGSRKHCFSICLSGDVTSGVMWPVQAIFLRNRRKNITIILESIHKKPNMTLVSLASALHAIQWKPPKENARMLVLTLHPSPLLAKQGLPLFVYDLLTFTHYSICSILDVKILRFSKFKGVRNATELGSSDCRQVLSIQFVCVSKVRRRLR